MKKIVVLISGAGTNLQAIIDACAAGRIDGKIAAVISNQPDAAGLLRAKTAQIPTALFERRDFADNRTMDNAVGDYIESLGADLIVLAGYMKILSEDFVKRFAGKILNIHPSLLPKYKGLHTYRRVLEAGEKEHGTTVHFVTEEVDGGAVVLQAKVPVFPDDDISSLERRVKARERQIYPLAVQWFMAGRLREIAGKAYLDGQMLPESGFDYE